VVAPPISASNLKMVQNSANQWRLVDGDAHGLADFLEQPSLDCGTIAAFTPRYVNILLKYADLFMVKGELP
jgi:hypothetical protein